MNRQQVDAIAQAVRYRLDTMWLHTEGLTAAETTAYRQGVMAAKLAALERIYGFNDPPPADWETYG